MGCHDVTAPRGITLSVASGADVGVQGHECWWSWRCARMLPAEQSPLPRHGWTGCRKQNRLSCGTENSDVVSLREFAQHVETVETATMCPTQLV